MKPTSVSVRRGYQHRRNVVDRGRYHVRRGRWLLQAESLQSAHWYGRTADLPDQSSQRQSAIGSCRSYWSRPVFPTVHRAPVQRRDACDHPARNPAHQSGQRRPAPEVAWRPRSPSVSFHGSPTSGRWNTEQLLTNQTFPYR